MGHSGRSPTVWQDLVVPRSNRLSLSIAGTAAVALASLPLAVSPASAARVVQGTDASIGVVEDASNAQQFNLKPQSASTGLVASRGRNDGGGKRTIPAFLLQLMEWFGMQTTKAFPSYQGEPAT